MAADLGALVRRQTACVEVNQQEEMNEKAEEDVPGEVVERLVEVTDVRSSAAPI